MDTWVICLPKSREACDMHWRKRKQSDFKAEIAAHLEIEAERLKEQGLSEAEARTAARRAFGNLTRAEESFYESGRWLWWDHFLQDLRFGLRKLVKNPGFTAVAVLTLALGIGASTAVFSLVNAVLLRDLPYRDPERLVFLYEPIPGIANAPLEAWGPVNGDFFTWQRVSRSFASLAMFTNDGLNASLGNSAFRATGSRVTAEFFRVLGVSPALGRTVDHADTEPGHGRVVVISHSLWQSRFGGDRKVLGNEILLNASPYRIIGVMPAGFAFPHGTESLETTGHATDIWVPWTMTPEQRASRDEDQGNAIGRLREGVNLSQALAEIATITSRFDPPFQQQNRKAQGVVRPV